MSIISMATRQTAGTKIFDRVLGKKTNEISGSGPTAGPA